MRAVDGKNVSRVQLREELQTDTLFPPVMFGVRPDRRLAAECARFAFFGSPRDRRLAAERVPFAVFGAPHDTRLAAEHIPFATSQSSPWLGDTRYQQSLRT